jgi:hypothetical protein
MSDRVLGLATVLAVLFVLFVVLGQELARMGVGR